MNTVDEEGRQRMEEDDRERKRMEEYGEEQLRMKEDKRGRRR
jgi:hypothetical protein